VVSVVMALAKSVVLRGALLYEDHLRPVNGEALDCEAIPPSPRVPVASATDGLGWLIRFGADGCRSGGFPDPAVTAVPDS